MVLVDALKSFAVDVHQRLGDIQQQDDLLSGKLQRDYDLSSEPSRLVVTSPRGRDRVALPREVI